MKFSQNRSFGKFFACCFLLFVVAACQSMPSPSSGPGVLAVEDAGQIDHLLTLIDQRLAVAPTVAKAKWNSGGAVNDSSREQPILDAVTAQAKGLDAGFVRRFFQAQVDASKALRSIVA